METLNYVRERKEEVKRIIRDYLDGFYDNKKLNFRKFDEESYVDSAMEGELVETINGELLDDEQCDEVVGNDDYYNYIDKLFDEVLEEEKYWEVKEFIETNYN